VLKSRGFAAEAPAASVAAIEAVNGAGASPPPSAFRVQGSGFRAGIYAENVATNATGAASPSAMVQPVSESMSQ